MDSSLKIALLFLFFVFSFCGKSLSQKEDKKFRLHSFSGNLGHHSIGWPFAFRTPYHFNFELDANWNRNPSKPNRLFSSSMGYTNRPKWSNDIYLTFSYHPYREIFKNRLFYSWKVGAGVVMSNHLNQMYVFENGQYKPKNGNTRMSGLMVLGLGLGYNLSDRFKIGTALDWRLQVPHGSGLPFLPHSNYAFKLTYILKR